jgi:hypothetical protein
MRTEQEERAEEHHGTQVHGMADDAEYAVYDETST